MLPIPITLGTRHPYHGRMFWLVINPVSHYSAIGGHLAVSLVIDHLVAPNTGQAKQLLLEMVAHSLLSNH